MNTRRRALRVLIVSLLCIISGTTGVTGLCQQAVPSAPNATQDRKPLTNADITRMVKGGFGESIIINAIGASDTQFDVSLDALFRLKEVGVSQRVIEAMQTAMTRQAAATVGTIQATPRLAPAVSVPQAQLTQPYVLYGEKSKAGIPASSPTIIQTKAKGDSVPALLADSAVKDIAGDAILSAAARSVMAAPGIAGLPIIGMAGMAILSLPKVFGSEPTYTFIYAIGGRRAASVVSSASPHFEIIFGDVVGANPDEFEPALLKVSPTDNNWRLVGAQKAKAKQFQSNDPSELNFIEERVPLNVTKIERGHVTVSPQQPLPAGEYGLVLRPISRTKKASLKAVAARQGDGLLLSPVWDFSVVPSQHQDPATENTAVPVQQATTVVGQPVFNPTPLKASPKADDGPGAVSFQTTASYDWAYEAALDTVKRAGYTIESASKETGQIKTAMAIEHGAVDIGRFVVVTVIKEMNATSTIRVEAYKQGRRIGGQWQQRVGTKDKAQKLADSIQVALSRP
ncbi:MAG: hypothetical protein QOE33_491 [Acidobacteriota bacterium]|nr:hypothetical protein [Acidobacteriota bacterium]